MRVTCVILTGLFLVAPASSGADTPGNLVYRSSVLATPLRISADPRMRRVTSIELALRDPSGDTATASLLLDERSWDIDAFGDAQPRETRRPPAIDVKLEPVADPSNLGRGLRLFALVLPNGELAHRIYFSWSPDAARDSLLLIRGEAHAPEPIALVSGDSFESFVPFEHVVPLFPDRVPPPGEGDGAQGDRISLRTYHFERAVDTLSTAQRTLGFLEISGELSGSGRFTDDRNGVSYTRFGEPGPHTLVSYGPRSVRFVRTMAVADARDRRRFELVSEAESGVQDPDRYFLVLAPTRAGRHRLIVERQGQIRHVLPLFNPELRQLRTELAKLAPGSDAERQSLLDIRRSAGGYLPLGIEDGHVTVALLGHGACREEIVSRLAGLTWLRELDMTECSPDVSATALKVLEQLPWLQHVNFDDTAAAAGRASLLQVSAVHRRADGTLRAPRPSDPGIGTLVDIGPLRSLLLERASAEHAGASYRAQLEQLSMLHLNRVHLEPSGEVQLKFALGQTRVSAALRGRRSENDPAPLTVSGVIDAARLNELLELRVLEGLEIANGSRLSEADLELLPRLSTLKQLTIEFDHRLNEEILGSLGGLKNLETLNVGTSASARAVVRLTRAMADTSVRVDFPAGSIEHTQGTLRLRGELDDVELEEILKLDDIRALELYGSRLIDRVLARGATRLERLHLSLDQSGRIPDAIATLPRLRELVLTGQVELTEADLVRLSSMKSLTLLDLRDTRITDAGAAALQAHLPGCRIEH